MGTANERAVVATDTVKAAGVVSLRVTVVGLTVQVAAVGAPEQLRVALPVAPVVPTMLRAYVAGEPAVTVAVVEEPSPGAMVRSTPLPVRLAELGPLVASDAMLMDAPTLPVAVGPKVALMVQVPSAATEVPQVLV